MISIKLGLRILAMVVLVTILAGCTNATATPTSSPTSIQQPTTIQQATFDLLRTQAAQTVVANLTQNAPTNTPVLPTATPVPTSTPAPTSTPLPTNTPLPPTSLPTATFVPWTSTPYYTATSTAYNCTITSVTPKTTDTLKAGQDFDGNWVVKNTGTSGWLMVDTDFKYVSGTKFQTKGDLFDFKSDVAVGASYTVIVDMLAPTDAGTYLASWAIVRSNQTICTLNLTVVVVK